MRRRWRKNTVGRYKMQRGGHGAVDHFQCVGVCILKGLLVIWIQTEFTVCPYNSSFRKIGLPPDLCFSGNACVIQCYFPKIMAMFYEL